MSKLHRFSCAILKLWLLFIQTASFALPGERDSGLFLRAEAAINQGKSAEAEHLLPALAHYPLYPHLLYQKLVRDLDNVAAIREFLGRYGETRQGSLLRRRWLERLASRSAWVEYVQDYRATENITLQCFYYLALANQGRTEESFAGAAKLWPTGDSLPQSCEHLFVLWRASPDFTSEHIWKRYSLAMQKGNLLLADALQQLVPASMRRVAAFWRQVHDHPETVLACAAWDPPAPLSGRIFAHGIERLAKNNPLLAQTAWSMNRRRFQIDAGEIARIDRRLALDLAAGRLAQAEAYLLELPVENTDAQIRGWRVRSALGHEDWSGALAAIGLMPTAERDQSQWTYWRARALENLGDALGARTSFRSAAKQLDFYGFAAADHIGEAYPLIFRAALIADADLERIAGRPEFLAIRELRALNRGAEARSDWMYAIRSLPPADLLAAAKLAERWELHNLAIITAARARNANDLYLRYPLGYHFLVWQAAQSLKVDPAMIFGLVRRESAFDPSAASPVGALGLLQIMPHTGASIARGLGENAPSRTSLLEPRRNLRYGVYYFRSLLEKFGNHSALAAAAYNAGPARVERWLPADHPIPADLWVETIPFSETRQYVAAVLSHALIYQARLNQNVSRLSDYLPLVPTGPRATVRIDRSVSVAVCD